MSYTYVQDPSQADGLVRDLKRARRIALDCEAAGFHRYADSLCLLQVTVGHDTYIVDPLAFDAGEVLRRPLEDPSVEVVMHGADYDLRLLQRDLGTTLRGLFDTQIAAALLGESALSLQALLESRLDVSLSKKYQRADWAQRPLSQDMLDYAAGDTRHLVQLADLLLRDLKERGRDAWADEECRVLEETATAPRAPGEDDEPEDPVVRVKGARDLSPREVTALRAALEWRDGLARERDRAAFRIVGDGPLMEVVLRRPADALELAGIKGFSSALARSDGPDLLERLSRVARLPDKEMRGYPRSARRGPPRPPPEVEALADKLKAARNRRAEELGLDRGTLLPNATLTAVALKAPRNERELARVDGIRRWQVGAVGEALLKVLSGAR
ncbi:MAG: HRDC domain-containing protein [Gemmatimonadetes bacterium]|nr:HRDC domain-containing protein [Gemmatimonadota bacterium]